MFFYYSFCFFFFSSRRRHTRWPRDWSSDVCSSDLFLVLLVVVSLDDIANHGAGSLAAVLSAFLHQDGYDDLRVAARGVTDKPSVVIEFFLLDRKSTRLNSSHVAISYAVFCLKKKKK